MEKCFKDAVVNLEELYQDFVVSLDYGLRGEVSHALSEAGCSLELCEKIDNIIYKYIGKC
jgi:hypothetical protein